MTFAELLIVMLVMTILAAAAAPAFVESLLFHRVESAARRVKSDLELARQTARLTSTTQTVSFTDRQYTVSGETSFHQPTTAYQVDLGASPYEIGELVANFSGNSFVTFDGYGKPTTGGTITLTAKNHQCTVTLDGTTGEAVITSSHPYGQSP
jgi:Tfp pilus assembly protein FimT